MALVWSFAFRNYCAFLATLEHWCLLAWGRIVLYSDVHPKSSDINFTGFAMFCAPFKQSCVTLSLCVCVSVEFSYRNCKNVAAAATTFACRNIGIQHTATFGHHLWQHSAVSKRNRMNFLCILAFLFSAFDIERWALLLLLLLLLMMILPLKNAVRFCATTKKNGLETVQFWLYVSSEHTTCDVYSILLHKKQNEQEREKTSTANRIICKILLL